MGTRVLMPHKPRLQSSKAIEERGTTTTKTIEVQTKGVAATPLESDLEGAKGVQGFWKYRRECIFDICITNTKSRDHGNTDPTKILAS